MTKRSESSMRNTEAVLTLAAIVVVIVCSPSTRPTNYARAREQKTTGGHIMLNADLAAPSGTDDLKGILAAHKGSCATYLHFKIPLQRSETIISLGEGFAVTPSDDLLVRIERLFGDRVAIFR